MRRIARQLLLPVLISFSLTGVSLAFLYFLQGKDEEDGEELGENGKKGRADPRPKGATVRECKIKRQFVPAVIGRAGATIKNIERRTRTQIRFKEENDVTCLERICEIRGSNEDIRLAENMIRDLIKDQPVIETYEMYVSPRVSSRMTAGNGKVLRDVQRVSGAKVIVEKSHLLSDGNPTTAGERDRRIIIKGTAEEIASAFSEISETIRKESAVRCKLESSAATRLPRSNKQQLSPCSTGTATATATATATVNGTEHARSDEPSPLLLGSMQVYVSAMESPSQFWIQVIDSASIALDTLVSEMTAYYNELENRKVHSLQTVSLGQIVAAKFSFDEQWYRAEVISADSEGERGPRYQVYFVDYGDRQLVEASDIFQLAPDFLALRLQAVECSLAHVKPCGGGGGGGGGGGDSEWSPEACDRFFDLTWVGQWKALSAKVKGYKERAVRCGTTRREGTPIPCVELYDKNDQNGDINVGTELINDGFAEQEDPPPFRPSSTSRLLLDHSSDVQEDSSTASFSGREDNHRFTRRFIRRHPDAEEIELTSADKRSDPNVQLNDLVTPDDTAAGHHRARRNDNRTDSKLKNGSFNARNCPTIAPAGYESDLSEDSDVALVLG